MLYGQELPYKLSIKIYKHYIEKGQYLLRLDEYFTLQVFLLIFIGV